MVVIRLARAGAKGRPFYHIVAADKRRGRDGKYIERLGFFNPTPAGADVGLTMVSERIAHWIANGAQPSPKVRDLIKVWNKQATAA